MNFKKRVTLIILSLNIFLTSCGLSRNNSNGRGNVDEEYNTKSSNSMIEIIESKYEGLSLSKEDMDILNSQVNFSSMQVFEESVKSIEVSYPYEELFCGEHINYEVSKSSEDYLNIDVLYKRVLENNKEYQVVHSNDTYFGTTNEFVYSVCQKIIDNYNKLETNGVGLDKEHINSNLANLKIFLYKGYNYGYYNSKQNILGINETLSSDEMKDVISHEVMHVLMGSNNKELESSGLKSKNGYLYSFDNREINPYNWTWFSEASAENLGCSLDNNKEPYVYAREINSIEAMKFATFNPNNDIECTLFSSNINKLYDCFPNLTHEEVNKMFYAYSIIFDNNTGQEGYYFYKFLENHGVVISSGHYGNFESNLRASIALSLSKEFYINFAKRIENKSISLNEIFEIISVFELELSRELWYQSKYPDLEYFLSNYCNIQEQFFEVICNSLGISMDYIKKLYYMFNNDVSLSNINVSFLTDKENDFINYINESRTGNKKDAILKVYDDNFTNNLGRMS